MLNLYFGVAAAPVNTDDAWGSPAPPTDSSTSDPFGDSSKKDDPWGALSSTANDDTGTFLFPPPDPSINPLGHWSSIMLKTLTCCFALISVHNLEQETPFRAGLDLGFIGEGGDMERLLCFWARWRNHMDALFSSNTECPNTNHWCVAQMDRWTHGSKSKPGR